MTTTIAAMPAFNEEKYIAKTIVGCKKYVDKVVVVDDGSTDATAEIAEARHPESYGATNYMQEVCTLPA